MNQKGLFKKRKPPLGSVPGSLNIDEKAPFPEIKLIEFDGNYLREEILENLEELKSIVFERGKVHWVDVQGLGDETLIRKLGDIFSLHPLALEDVTNVPQIPKVDEYENCIFICLPMLRMDETGLVTEQVSVFVGETFVLTFQERYGDVLDPVRKRIRRNAQMRNMSNDYTAYAIVDTIVDNYFPVLQELGNDLENLEDELVETAAREKLKELYILKHRLAHLKRLLWPTRDAIGRISRDGSKYFGDQTSLYLRDVYDHVMQSIDMLDLSRELASELMNLYLSSTSNRMNEIMKVLTVISTIFIPLSFMAGLYGMNFHYMPELSVKWAYPAVLIAMAIVVLIMLFFIHKKGWFRK
ncbi:magnesium/cobalt transporter CorA [Mesotoga sp. UBA6090]|uniref:magnesium/cobalt transporter CorA n=1 Tax=Mesotoga sp. UBA6090 TaxID=1946860 RepID=UPI0025E38E75|nr:magnesium/cobalt transporter CorA [Mesotoga sp. UBA6090]